MKHLSILICILLAFNPVKAQSPKHEVRAVWLTVVQGLDWPRTTDQAQQRNDLTTILDHQPWNQGKEGSPGPRDALPITTR